MADKRSVVNIRIAAAKRYVMWYYLSQRLDLLCVNEYPKCGASWLCQILSDYLALPFARNESPQLEKSLIHGHHLPNKKFNNQVCFIRDGRDVMVSLYFHLLIGNSKMSIHGVPRFRKLMPFQNFEDIPANLPQFIRYMFAPKPIYPSFSWKAFCDKMLNENHFYVRYEDMLANPVAVSKHVLETLYPTLSIDKNKLQLICNKYSFNNQKSKEKEKGKSYLRKGISGDWKNYFTEEACIVFDEFAGDTLTRLNYGTSSLERKIILNAVN